jgi:MFS family permease
VYALTFVLGVASAIDNPARRGLVLELVEPENISNAMSLNTAVMTGSRVFGPALAAWLVVAYGTAWCFLVNAVSFGAVIWALVAMDPERLRTTPPAPRGGKPVREGLVFIWSHPRIRLAFVVMAIVSTFAFNYTVALPLIAQRRFASEAAFGWMLAITGLGSFGGSLALARLNRSSMPIYLGAVGVLGVGAVGIAWAPNLAVAYVFSIVMGFGGAVFIASANILTQEGAPPTMRSRLLALTAVAFLGSTPIGGPITGWIGDHVSAEWSLAYGAIISVTCAAAAGAVLLRRGSSSARLEWARFVGALPRSRVHLGGGAGSGRYRAGDVATDAVERVDPGRAAAALRAESGGRDPGSAPGGDR